MERIPLAVGVASSYDYRGKMPLPQKNAAPKLDLPFTPFGKGGGGILKPDFPNFQRRSPGQPPRITRGETIG